MSIQALREARAAKAKEVEALLKAKSGKWNEAEDTPVYDAAMAEIDALNAQIKRIEAFNESVSAAALNSNIEESAARFERDKGEGGKLYARWLRGGDKALSAEDWQRIRATMSTGTGSEGGFTVPSEVVPMVIEALKKFGGMRSVANVIQTATGISMSWPTSDGTAEEGEIVAENVSASDLDISFGTKSLTAYKYSSKVVTAPIELLMDSAIDVEAFIKQRLVKRLGRITNKHFTIGTGTSQPLGLMTGAGVGVTASNGTSQVTAITYESLVDMQHSVDAEYRDAGNCGWMFHDDTLRIIRKIKDSVGAPIFVPGYEQGNPGGMPDRLLGDPITINNQCATMAANARSIAYGDFSAYVIRDVMEVLLQRYDDSAYAKKGQVGFQGWLRSGGTLPDAGAVKVFINAAS